MGDRVSNIPYPCTPTLNEHLTPWGGGISTHFWSSALMNRLSVLIPVIPLERGLPIQGTMLKKYSWLFYFHIQYTWSPLKVLFSPNDFPRLSKQIVPRHVPLSQLLLRCLDCLH